LSPKKGEDAKEEIMTTMATFFQQQHKEIMAQDE